MPSHRSLRRPRDVRPEPSIARQPEPSSARGVAVEETFVPDVDELPKPAGFGTEASTSAQSFSEVDEYTVPAGALARLREASLSLESNGEARLSVGGTVYGPYTGATDISIPLDPCVLTEGYQVRVFHQSTDGNSTTTKAQLVVGEV